MTRARAFERHRRSFLTRAGAAAAIGPLLVTERTIAQTRTLYVNSWGGSFTAAQEAAYFKPFTAATGIQVRTITPVSYGRIKAQVQSGSYQVDMTSFSSVQWLRASREGLAEPIDWSIVKREQLPPDAIVADGPGIASYIQGTNLCYRNDKFPNGGPGSWADFWDVKRFPGSRSLCINDAFRTLTFALLADGVPRDQLHPLDVDRAFRKLDQIKPHIKVWWREGTQSQQLIRDGEVDMMSIWNARATELRQQGIPVTLVWNGAVRSTSTWCVLKGAPNRKLAWELIQFAAQARPQAEFNSRLYYGPVNPGAYEFIAPAIRAELPTYPDNLAVSVRGDDHWEADRIAPVEERFTQWVAS
ncbi:MAG: ABC transporter substrate-binding protein [Hyphomicrobiales bacterium]|nr:ABC transporter substrate-binding protein [Hyphomicrobiales bacterium]